MLPRNSFTREEVEEARSAVDRELAAYREIVQAAGAQAAEALADFEPLLCNSMTMMLDRHFVHRVRTLTGKDGNPLNEVELICDSLMDNDGVLRANNVIKYIPEQAVVELDIGERIRMTLADFERLSSAFLAELESRIPAS
jgi:hypothetical protein